MVNIVSQQKEETFGASYPDARDLTAEIVRIAYQYISDSEKRKCFVKNAAKEYDDALMAAQGYSPDADNFDIDEQIQKCEHLDRMTLMDVLDTDGILLKAALMCKNNGVLPYYMTGILAFALLDTFQDSSVTDIQEYVRCNGLRSAISKYSGLHREPELVLLIADQYKKIKDNDEDAQEKITVMKKAYHSGFCNEMKYKGCAQCTLLSMFQLFGRQNDVLFQSASALAAGMALSGDGACGGYSGGIMYMGSIVGRRLEYLEEGDKAAKEMSYHMAQTLRDRFIEAYGSVICADVHKEIFGESYSLRTREIKEAFEAAGAHTTKCTTVIGTVGTWLAEIIYDSEYTAKQTD